MSNVLVKSDDAIFRVMDHLDEEAYLAELKGRVVDSWVYHFNDDGKELWGLSKIGIDEASSELARSGEVIRELDLQILTDPDLDFERYVVKAGRFAVRYNATTNETTETLLETVFGTKRQCKFVQKRSGRGGPNSFYFEQGAMKAARNARARLIPATVKAKIIALAKEKGRVRDIKREEVEDQTQPAEPPHKPVKPQGGSVISEAQVKRLFAIAKSAGWENDELKRLIQSYGHEHTNEILRSEYEEICRHVESGDSRKPGEDDQ